MPEKEYIITSLLNNQKFKTYHIVIEHGIVIFRDENGYYQNFSSNDINIEVKNLV